VQALDESLLTGVAEATGVIILALPIYYVWKLVASIRQKSIPHWPPVVCLSLWLLQWPFFILSAVGCMGCGCGGGLRPSLSMGRECIAGVQILRCVDPLIAEGQPPACIRKQLCTNAPTFGNSVGAFHRCAPSEQKRPPLSLCRCQTGQSLSGPIQGGDISCTAARSRSRRREDRRGMDPCRFVRARAARAGVTRAPIS
jgi:hypothetical protein